MLKNLIFLVFVACACAMVCEPDACKTVQCVTVTPDNCAGTIQHNGSYCGCCDLCVNNIGNGVRCVPDTLLLGAPQSNQCGTNMYCDSQTYTCKQSPTAGPCTKKLEEVNAQLSAFHNTLVGLEKPNCNTTTGMYLGMQVSGSQAYCVTEDGTSITGYMVNRWEAGKMNCNCARDKYKYQQTGLVGKTFSCEANGNYASMGCIGSVCYCQDENGKQVGTSTVSIGAMNSLNC